MRFAKWQGIGNDYLIVDAAEIPAAFDGATRIPDTAVRAICDRNFGIGGDGILVLGPSEVADAHMVIHNPDASEAEMCGNGVRMAARWLRDTGKVAANTFAIETAGGVVHPTVLEDGRVAVDMGCVQVEDLDDIDIADLGETLHGRPVSVGNPHFVVELDPDTVDLPLLGLAAEHHPRFPNRANIEFIRVESPSEVTMRVWERGVGETLACGSGACAVGVSAVLDHGCISPVTVHLLGGDLEIAVADDLRVTMTGAARLIYEGEVDVTALDTRPDRSPTGKALA